MFRKHPGEISQAADHVGRPVKKALDIERRQNLSDLLGCRQSRGGGGYLVLDVFPKVFPSGMKTAPGEFSEGRFTW